MHDESLRNLLEAVADGRTDVAEAVGRLRRLPFEDLDFAKIDHHRLIRCGFPEVVFCLGKTPERVAAIVGRIAAQDSHVLATRATPEHFQAVKAKHSDAEYHETARAIVIRRRETQEARGLVVIVSAGTSDESVAEEARVTLEAMGRRVETVYDAGVAGIHRLLAHGELLQQANAVVAVAGMEGALPSVVGGLTSCPVIAVPTSVGYGASFGGVAALLAMLNSCASGVAVVNIDNGFGAGYVAALISRGADAEASR